MIYTDTDLLHAYIFHIATGAYVDPQPGDWITAHGSAVRYAHVTQVTGVARDYIEVRMQYGDTPWRTEKITRSWWRRGRYMLVPKLFTTEIPPDDAFSC